MELIAICFQNHPTDSHDCETAAEIANVVKRNNAELEMEMIYNRSLDHLKMHFDICGATKVPLFEKKRIFSRVLSSDLLTCARRCFLHRNT